MAIVAATPPGDARVRTGAAGWMRAGTAVVLMLMLHLVSAVRARAEPGALCRDPAVNAMVGAAARDTLPEDQLVALWRRFDPDSIPPKPECDNTVAFCLGRKLALVAVDRAYARLNATPPDLEGARALLREGHLQGSPWQLLVTMGDVDAALAHQNGDASLYHDAAGELQFALNAIEEPPLCAAFGEVSPQPDEVARIRKRTQEAVMLSPRFDLARTKSGDCGGIFLDIGKSRGIDVESVPVPITFEFAKADFTAEGQKAADALLTCLREKKLQAVTLTGHTDAQGSDALNMDLSARRLATVQAYLKAGGYTGTLNLVPMGKRELFQPDDPQQHSAAEIDQMNRRVELRDVKP